MEIAYRTGKIDKSREQKKKLVWLFVDIGTYLHNKRIGGESCLRVNLPYNFESITPTRKNGNPETKTLPLESICLTKGTLSNQIDLTQLRITSEPTYQGAIARSFSPENETLSVVIQQMRKMIIQLIRS